MQNKMSHVPNFFTELMIQLCSEVSTVEPVLKLLKGFTDIALSWAANLSYLVKITTSQTLLGKHTLVASYYNASAPRQ